MIVSNAVFAQSGSRYVQMLQESAEEIYNDVGKGEKTALSVLNSTSDDSARIYSLLILSEAEQLRGNFVVSLNYLYNAENIAHSTENECLNGISLLALNHLYQNIGLNKLANSQLDSLIQHNNCTNSTDYLFRLEFEKSMNLSGKEEIEALKKLIENLNPNVFSHDIFRSKINLELAEAYKNLSQKDSATFYYNRILFAKLNPVFIARAKLGLAELNIQPLENLIAADSLLKIHSDSETQTFVFSALADYYLQNKNTDLYKQEILHYNDLNNAYTQNKKEARDLVIAHIENLKKENQSIDINYIAIFSGLILLAVGGIFYYLKTKKDYRKFLQLMSEKNENPQPKIPAIPEQTEQLLLNKLEKFERSNKFIQPGISLSGLAKSLDTNTKYLSDVINRNKEVNFNQYINELRINYIIQKMKEEPKYLNYKIYYLAEECGFSSQSSFSSVFKLVTGISPLAFIKFLKNEKQA